MERDFNAILNLLNKKSTTIIWLSGIDKQRNLTDITKLWDVDTRSKFLYKGHKEKLKKLELVEVQFKPTKSSRIGIFCSSKFDWLADYFSYLANEYKQSHIVAIIETFFPILDMDEKEILKVLNSDAFRKGCMNLNFLIEEIASAKATHTSLEFMTKKYEPEMPEKPSTATFIGDFWVPQISTNETSRNFKDSEIEEFKKIYEDAKKELWKHEFSWQLIILGRLQLLSLFKAFQEDKRCLNYWESGHVHIPAIFSAGLIPIDKIYKLIMDKKYKIPEKVKPLFTIKQLAEEEVSSLKFIKNEWQDVWKEIKKELNLREEK